MVTIYIHTGGGCEAITDEHGNELTDLEIHRYLCSGPAEYRVTLPGGISKGVCSRHREQFTSRFGLDDFPPVAGLA